MFCRLDREQRPITVFPLDFARIARPLAARLLADPANHFAGLGRPLGTGYPQLPRERSDASLPLFKVVAYHFHEARQSRASQLTSKSAPVTSSQVVYFQHRLSPQKRRRGKPVVGCGRSHRLFNPAPPEAWLHRRCMGIGLRRRRNGSVQFKDEIEQRIHYVFPALLRIARLHDQGTLRVGGRDRKSAGAFVSVVEAMNKRCCDLRI